MKLHWINKTLIIENNIIPFKGFIAINLFGIIFTRNFSYLEIEHELVHSKQILECLILFFYPLYILE